MVSIGGGAGRFVSVVMMVERGDATGVLVLFQISQFNYIVFCTSYVKVIVNTCGS
jgi:hypothetical protein